MSDKNFTEQRSKTSWIIVLLALTLIMTGAVLYYFDVLNFSNSNINKGRDVSIVIEGLDQVSTVCAYAAPFSEVDPLVGATKINSRENFTDYNNMVRLESVEPTTANGCEFIVFNVAYKPDVEGFNTKTKIYIPIGMPSRGVDKLFYPKDMNEYIGHDIELAVRYEITIDEAGEYISAILGWQFLAIYE